MRIVSALMPAQRRRYETWRWIGLGLVVAGVLLSVVGTGVVGVLAVVPIVTGGALFTVSSVRWWDLAVDTARSFQADQAVRSPQLEDRATVSVAAVSSARRSAVVLGAALSVLALGAGVAGSVLPVLGSTQADGASLAAVDEPAPLSTATPTTVPTRGAHGSPVGPVAVADGTVQIGQVDDEEAWSAVCGAVSSDSGCSAWAVVASGECDLDVTIGFADTQHGATTRTELRSVRVRPGTPVFVASVGDELWSGIESAACRSQPAVDEHVATWFATDDPEAAPEECWELGCIGFDVLPSRDCPQADVQFAVYDDYGGLGNPHDLVVPLELHEGTPVTAWASGTESFEGDAVLTRVSCR